MKKRLLIVGLVISFLISGTVLAEQDAKQILKGRLAHVENFYGRFSQVVKTKDKQLVQDGKGELWVKRPCYFNWTMSEPDELAIISDCDTVWIYTPMVDQVSAMWLKNVSDNRLLLLISDSTHPVWEDYSVTQQRDLFHLTPLDGVGQHFDIMVKSTGVITQFTITEEDGQTSFYKLSRQKLGTINPSKFQFKIPAGVTLDDQRQ